MFRPLSFPPHRRDESTKTFKIARVVWSSRRSDTRFGDVRNTDSAADSECSWIVRLNSRTLVKSIRIWSRMRDEFETLIKSIALNQYSFFVVVFYRLLICASTDQCWYLYGDDTIQVSILYVVVYWLNEIRGSNSYLLCGLYVEVWVTWLTLTLFGQVTSGW
jgi:hypothetical protein